MVLDPDPSDKREALERPPMPPGKPARAPWLALLAVLVLGLIGWWMMEGNTVDPETTSSTAPVVDASQGQ